MNVQGVNKINEVYNTNKSTAVKGKAKVEMPKDSLAISNISKDYGIALKTIKNVPDVRCDVVEDVKQQIASGSYSVSGEEILQGAQKYMFDRKI